MVLAVGWLVMLCFCRDGELSLLYCVYIYGMGLVCVEMSCCGGLHGYGRYAE